MPQVTAIVGIPNACPARISASVSPIIQAEPRDDSNSSTTSANNSVFKAV